QGRRHQGGDGQDRGHQQGLRNHHERARGRRDVSVSPIQTPDSPLVDSLYPSRNIEPRQKGLKPSILILHYTGLPTLEQALDVLSRTDCKVSCHYVVADDGCIIQMVAEHARAWHAGVSCWQG